jgi:hypothetical protein
MTTPELLSFVRTQLSKGTNKDSITSILRGAGWDEVDISDAFNIIEPKNTPNISNVPITPSTPVNTVNPTASVENKIGSNPPIVKSDFSYTPYVAPHTTQEMPTSSVVTPVAQTQTAGSNDPRPKKSHFIPMLIFTLFLLLLGGAGAFAYYLGYFESPSLVVAMATKNMQDSTSAKFDMTINTKLKYNDPSKGGTSILGIDFSDMLFQIKGSSESIKNVTTGKTEDKGNMDMSVSLGTIEASLKFRFLDNVSYFMLDKAPTFGIADISKYQNKWYSMKLDNEQDTSLNMTPVIGAGKSAIDKLTDAEKAELDNITMNATFIKVLNKNGTDTLEGVNTSRYLFDLDKTGIVDYAIQLKNFAAKLSNRDSYFSTFANYDIKKVSDALDKVKNFQGEIWVGRKDKLPHKMTISFSNDFGTTPETMGTIDVNLFVLLSDWNMPVNVEVPADVVDFQSLINSQLEEARIKGDDAFIRANLSNMRPTAELFYDGAGNYKGFCKSTAIYGGAKIMTSLNDKIKPDLATCKDSTRAWIAYSPLKGKDYGPYWCVDSTGANTSKEKAPIGMLCN